MTPLVLFTQCDQKIEDVEDRKRYLQEPLTSTLPDELDEGLKNGASAMSATMLHVAHSVVYHNDLCPTGNYNRIFEFDRLMYHNLEKVSGRRLIVFASCFRLGTESVVKSLLH